MYSSPAESVLPKEAFSQTRSSCSVHLPGEGASLSRPLSSQLPRDRAACNATHTQQYCDSTHTAHSQTDSHGATRDGSILQPTAVESKSKTQNGRSCGGFSVLCILMILSKKVFKHLMSFMCLSYQASPHTKFWLSDVAQLLFHLQSMLPRSRVLTQTWHLSRVRRKHSVAKSRTLLSSYKAGNWNLVENWYCWGVFKGFFQNRSFFLVLK